MIYMWSDGCEFNKLVDLTNLQEGDIIKLFKYLIDFHRQIRRATDNFELASIIDEARLLIDRDIISLTL